MASPLSYRRDIDGLRALAVLPVLLFHAGVPGFGGGFVGVDIFFVISGYLITGIIAREVDQGNFSIVSFYERRARRILPALFVMIAFVLAAASLLYLPGDFEGVPRSAAMALGFLANVWFFLNTGYFAGGAETMPLLHTWSLGVEEQFYIGFPVLLLLIGRFIPDWRLAAVAGLTVLSFVIAVVTQDWGDGSAFYLLPGRAWELFVGSLLALGAVPAVRHGAAREAIAIAGLAAIVAAVALYDERTLFPGVTALLPVLGSAALIHCAPGTRTGRVLSIGPAVWIGLISYSLYLWHWPLIVFTEYAQNAPLALWQSGYVVAASIFLAWASWRYVERPFRSPQRFPRKRIFAWSGGGMAALGSLAIAQAAQGGWPERFSPEVARFADAARDFSPKRADCFSQPMAAMREHCNLGAKTAPSAVIWGDSHAVEIAWALGERLAADNRAIAQRTHGSCPPVLDFAEAANPACPAFNDAVIREIEADPSIREVYLAAFWADPRYHKAGTLGQLEATMDRLRKAGRRVVLIGAVPSQPFNVPRTLAKWAATGGSAIPPGTPLSDHERAARWLAANFPRWRDRGIAIYDPAEALVEGSDTLIVADGQPLYFDSHHLSLAGARRVVAGLEEWRHGQDRDHRQRWAHGERYRASD